MNSRKMILVTGASGYVGSHAIDALLAAGYDTVGTTRKGSYAVNPFSQLVSCDVADQAQLDSMVKQFKPSAIVHLAAKASVEDCVANPVACFGDNLSTTLAVLEAARNNDVTRVVVASSNVVYGAESPYRAGKLASELACAAYQSTYGLSVLCLRFANLYGGGRKSGVVAKIMEAKQTGKKVAVYGDPESRRDYLHVQDAAQALLLAIPSSATGVMDICSGAEVSVTDMLRWTKVEAEPMEPRPGDVHKLPQMAQDAEARIGFRACVRLGGWLCAQ